VPRKAGLRNKKKKLTLRWVDEQFELTLEHRPDTGRRSLETPRSMLLLDHPLRAIREIRSIAKR
jgi:hypothetical protein